MVLFQQLFNLTAVIFVQQSCIILYQQNGGVMPFYGGVMKNLHLKNLTPVMCKSQVNNIA